MPIAKVEFKPGINRENTTYSNEGGFYLCDKIRFRSGYAEKIGGWYDYSVGNSFLGVARSLFNWVTSASENFLALGTSQKYYVEYNGTYRDITPLQTTAFTISSIASTSGSKLFTVTTSSAHGLSAGTYLTLSASVAVGGVTLSGSYEVVAIPSTTTYTISAASAASSTATVSAGLPTATYDINAGTSSFVVSGGGYGVGPYGNGGYGQATTATVTTGTQLTLWSQSNYSDNLVFAPRNGPIYFWVKDTAATPARATTINAYANTQVKTTKATGVTFTAGIGVSSPITVPDTINISVGAVVTGIGIPTGTYVTGITSATSVTLSANTTAGSSGSYTFSYAGRFAPNQTMQVLTSDIYQFVIALGSNPYDPTNNNSTYNPMLVRWSDQSNPAEWVPEVGNQSGEQLLGNGSYLVCGRSTRQEILIWSNSALYAMQYVGAPYVFSFQLLMDNISIASQNAAITVNNVTYWMGTDKFFMYAGQVQTLPCTLRTHVFGNINHQQEALVVCGSNPAFNEVWWFYPSSGSLVNDSYVVYNYLENIWYYGSLNRSAWLATQYKQYPLAVTSVQNTYIASAIDSSVTTIPVINARAYPVSGTVLIDSEYITYTGVIGNNLTGCTRGALGTTAASHVQYSPVTFSIKNQVLYHEYLLDDQSTDFTSPNTPRPIAAFIESSDFDIQDGHSFSFVNRILPDLGFSNSTAPSPSVTLTIKPRVNSGTPYIAGVGTPTVTRTQAAPVAPLTYPIEQYTGQVYTRVRGRQMAFRIDSTDLGVTWQLGSMRFDVRPDGRRA